MDIVSRLRAQNPGLPFYCVQDEAFRPFGRVIEWEASSLMAACQQAAVMPETGSRYVPSLEPLEAISDFAAIKNGLMGEGSCQIGCCWGYNSMLGCLEYHRASEFNIAVSDMVLLVASRQDMEGLELPAGKITGFYCPKGTVLEVYATTMHFCPCQVSAEGFRCIVILPRGTNLPLENPRVEIGDGRLLWARDKWLIAHPENAAVIQRGAYPGLRGENFQIHYEE